MSNQILLAALSAIMSESTVAVVYGSVETLDPTHLGSSITLSNGNLTALQGGAGATNALSIHGYSTGKYYFEVSVADADLSIGVSSAYTEDSTVLSIRMGFNNYSVALNNAGDWMYEGGNSDTAGPSFSAGDTLGIAIDTSATAKMWYKNITQGGGWIGTSAGDPVAATNGRAFGGIIGTAPWHVGLGMVGGDSGLATFNFGALPFAGPVPTGYTSWPGT